MSIRTTISLPEDLKARMDAAAEPVNWSAEAAKCFERVLGEIASRKATKELSDVVSRLRATRIDEEDETKADGFRLGQQWAQHVATYRELDRATDIDRNEIWMGEPMAPWCRADLVAFQINPKEADSGSSAEFWERAGTSLDTANDEDFLDGFLDGAHDIWQRVADRL
jgi:hypothetical protein